MTNTIFIGGVQGNRHLESDKPYSGFKIAMFKLNKDNEIDLVPPHYHRNITKVSAEALCKRKHDTNESFQKCECGFYSYRTVRDGIEHAANFSFAHNCFFVEVALSGKVVIAEKGYKSTQQRVKTIVVPQCSHCNDENSELFIIHKSGYLLGVCQSCKNNYAEDTQLSFEEFQEKTQVTGFKPITILSSLLFPEIVNELFGNYDENLMITDGFRALIEKGDVVSLMSQRLVIDDALNIALAKESDENE